MCGFLSWMALDEAQSTMIWSSVWTLPHWHKRCSHGNSAPLPYIIIMSPDTEFQLIVSTFIGEGGGWWEHSSDQWFFVSHQPSQSVVTPCLHMVCVWQLEYQGLWPSLFLVSSGGSLSLVLSWTLLSSLYKILLSSIWHLCLLHPGFPLPPFFECDL